MLFAFRYWKRVVSGAVRPYIPFYAAAILLGGLIFWRNILLGNPILTYLVRSGLSAAVILAFLGIFGCVFTAVNHKLYSVFNCYGFGEEYYEEFIKHRGNAINIKVEYMAEYAEILMKSGFPLEALDYLDKTPIPPNSSTMGLAMRLNIYVISALKAGDPELAEIEWGKWQGFISACPDRPMYYMTGFLLNYTKICMECCAGRYGEAYRLLTEYMRSREYRRYHPDTLDCEILMLYILKSLGWTEQFDELLSDVSARVERLCRSRFSPLFDSQAVAMREDFNKAINGIMPL